MCTLKKLGGRLPQAPFSVAVMGDWLDLGQPGLHYERAVTQVCPLIVEGHRG